MTRSLIVLIAFLVFFTAEIAEIVAREKSIKKAGTESKANRFVSSLYATPKSIVRNMQKATGKTILVDLRCNDLFDRVRIPSAVNVAFFKIKIKGLQKKTKLKNQDCFT